MTSMMKEIEYTSKQQDDEESALEDMPKHPKKEERQLMQACSGGRGPLIFLKVGNVEIQ